MIAIIDYGMGNLRSVENALRYLKTDYCITNDAEVLRKAMVGSYRELVPLRTV